MVEVFGDFVSIKVKLINSGSCSMIKVKLCLALSSLAILNACLDIPLIPGI